MNLNTYLKSIEESFNSKFCYKEPLSPNELELLNRVGLAIDLKHFLTSKVKEAYELGKKENNAVL